VPADYDATFQALPYRIFVEEWSVLNAVVMWISDPFSSSQPGLGTMPVAYEDSALAGWWRSTSRRR
jgi:hypothetical protein